MVLSAGVEEREPPELTPIYCGWEEGWPNLIRSLRPGDEVVVADPRIFGSRKRLGEAAAQVAARNVPLVSAITGVAIDPETLKEVHRVEGTWAGERSIGGSKRAKEMSLKGNKERRRLIEASRMPQDKAKAIYRDMERFPLKKDAIAAMGPGWNSMKAWRAFGPRSSKNRRGWMTVWAVCTYVDYEGYNAPTGIYSTKEKADDVAAELNRPGYEGRGVDVIEYVLDAVE